MAFTEDEGKFFEEFGITPEQAERFKAFLDKKIKKQKEKEELERRNRFPFVPFNKEATYEHTKISEDLSKYVGELEINHQRGVIYFHAYGDGKTLLRICRLEPIPVGVAFIDLTGGNVSYTAEFKARNEPDPEAKARLESILRKEDQQDHDNH